LTSGEETEVDSHPAFDLAGQLGMPSPVIQGANDSRVKDDEVGGRSQ